MNFLWKENFGKTESFFRWDFSIHFFFLLDGFQYCNIVIKISI